MILFAGHLLMGYHDACCRAQKQGNTRVGSSLSLKFLFAGHLLLRQNDAICSKERNDINGGKE